MTIMDGVSLRGEDWEPSVEFRNSNQNCGRSFVERGRERLVTEVEFFNNIENYGQSFVGKGRLATVILKGECHEIFASRFFS
jgi:hypothetical protein